MRGFVFTDLRTLLFWLCSLFLFYFMRGFVSTNLHALALLSDFIFIFISCAAVCHGLAHTCTPLLIYLATALCLRTCAHSSSDYFHYFHFISLRGFVSTNLRALALLFWLYILSFYYFMRGFVFTDLRTLALSSDKYYYLSCALCVNGLVPSSNRLILLLLIINTLFMCGFVFTDLRTLLLWLFSLFLFYSCAACVYELALLFWLYWYYWYNLSCAALCLRLRTLASSSDFIIIIIIISCAALCLRLAHTCTPLLINIFICAVCVYGLAHTCTPLQNKLILILLSCVALYLRTCAHLHSPSVFIFFLFHAAALCYDAHTWYSSSNKLIYTLSCAPVSRWLTLASFAS